jgi:hypothetical protein
MSWRTFAGLASKPAISSGERVTLGAPFFSGVGGALAEGVAVASGVSVGLGIGVGVGEVFLRFVFAFVSGVGLGDGVGEVFFRFGEAAGDGVGVGFLADRFRCFRAGVGVGVAARNFLIFVPNDSSALLGATFIPKEIAPIRRLRRTTFVAANKISGPVPVELLCSCECRLPDFREGNSRWASARGNREAPVPSGASRRRGCCETARRSGCSHLRE